MAPRARAGLVLAVVLVAAPLLSAYDENEECQKLCHEGAKSFQAKEYEQARDLYDKARKADPRSARAQKMYGSCLGFLAETTSEAKATFDQAIAEWEKVLAMEDASASLKALTYDQLGNCYMNAKKRPEKALECFKAGLALAPESGDLWSDLGQYHLRQESWGEALDCIEKATKYGVDDLPDPDYLNRIHKFLKEKVGVRKLPATFFSGTLPLPSLGGVATTADLATLVASVPTTAQLVYFETAEPKEAKRVSLEFQPGQLAIQGKTLFAAARGAPKLFTLDLESGEVRKTIKLAAALTGLSCHRSKGLIYGLAVTGEVVSVDPSSGHVTTCQAKGSHLVVDPLRPGTVYVATGDAKGEKTALRRYTASGGDLKLADTNDDAAVHGCGLEATADGKRVAVVGSGGWRDRAEGLKEGVVAVLETERLSSVAGLLDTKGSPRSLVFHPSLDLGVALTDTALIQFSSKSFVHVKDWTYSSGMKANEPRFLAFVDGGRKLACWESGDASKKEDGALRFLALQLTADDEAAIQKALGKGR